MSHLLYLYCDLKISGESYKNDAAPAHDIHGGGSDASVAQSTSVEGKTENNLDSDETNKEG